MSVSNYRPGLSRDRVLVDQLKAFQQNPQSVVFVSLSEAYRSHGLFDQALEICEEGLQYHPQLSSAHLLHAKIFFDLKRYADCLEKLSGILKDNPDNFRALKLRADVFLRLGQKRSAIDVLSQICVLFPQDKESAQKLEALENEMPPLKQKISPSLVMRASSDFLPSAGRVEDYRVAKLAEAVSVSAPSLTDALYAAPVEEQDNEPAFATKTIAELYLRQGLRGKALQVLHKMLQDNPNDAWVKDRLQDVGMNTISTFTSSTKKVVLAGREKLQARANMLERLLVHVQKLKRA